MFMDSKAMLFNLQKSRQLAILIIVVISVIGITANGQMYNGGQSWPLQNWPQQQLQQQQQKLTAHCMPIEAFAGVKGLMLCQQTQQPKSYHMRDWNSNPMAKWSMPKRAIGNRYQGNNYRHLGDFFQKRDYRQQSFEDLLNEVQNSKQQYSGEIPWMGENWINPFNPMRG